MFVLTLVVSVDRIHRVIKLLPSSWQEDLLLHGAMILHMIIKKWSVTTTTTMMMMVMMKTLLASARNETSSKQNTENKRNTQTKHAKQKQNNQHCLCLIPACFDCNRCVFCMVV